MDKDIQDLLEKAFYKCSGIEANKEIFRLRQEFLEKYGGVVAYELVLDKDEEWLHFRNETIPQLIDFLRSKGYDPLRTNEVFLPIFHQNELFFIHISDLRTFLMKKENLNQANFVNSINTWRLESQGLEMLPVPCAALESYKVQAGADSETEKSEDGEINKNEGGEIDSRKEKREV